MIMIIIIILLIIITIYTHIYIYFFLNCFFFPGEAIDCKVKLPEAGNLYILLLVDVCFCF